MHHLRKHAWKRNTLDLTDTIQFAHFEFLSFYPHRMDFFKGASALQTVELDYEKGPQLRVAEGDEHAAFLSLFNGQMIIYRLEFRIFIILY